MIDEILNLQECLLPACRLQLAFPNGEYIPAHAFELFAVFFIAFSVALNLLFPKFNV